MPIKQHSLPHDLDALDAPALRALLLTKQAAVESLLASVGSRDSKIERLTLIIAKLRRQQYGRSSEKLDRQIEQMELKLEELQADRGAEELASSAIAPDDASATVPVKRKPARKPLPDHLPRDTRTHQSSERACPQCQGKLNHLGEDVSETLDYVPGHFKVVRHVRPKYSCACCSQVVQAPSPSRPIAKGLYEPGLLAQLIVSKYGYHLPLYRQAQIYEHAGVTPERSTMSDAVGGVTQLLQPLIEALRRYVLVPGKLHADDVPVPVLSPGKGTTKTGRLWVYVRDNRPAGDTAAPAVWFAYSADRKGEHP